MSEPAVYTVIRDGKKRFFVNDWWSTGALRRELIWGPDDFEAWVEQFEQVEEWNYSCAGSALVDYDKNTLMWCCNVTSLKAPRIWRTYSNLLSSAWPNFTVKYTENNNEDMADYLGLPHQTIEMDSDDEESDVEYDRRFFKINEARLDDPEDEEDQAEEDDDSLRAWVTLIDEDGSTRQRQLRELSLDLLKGEAAALDALAKLPPAEIPREAWVSEGLILNPSKKTARMWGSNELLGRMKEYGKLWNGWRLKWTHRGYAEQCATSGTQGLPMSDIDVLAKILPLVLSTAQVNANMILGSLGGGVKKLAKKATGCLVFLLCIPLVLFGAFSGNWTAVLYSMGATAGVIVGLYLYVARKVRKAVTDKMPNTDDEPEFVVAGPLEAEARKARIDQLLVKANLPRLHEVEPHLPETTGLELLAS